MECKRCGHPSSTKSNLLQHLRRKKPCPTTLSCIDREEYINELLHREYNEITYACNNCGRKFNTRQSRCRHNKVCNPQKTIEDDQPLPAQDQNTGITMNNCTIANMNVNNTITNIYVKDFKHVDGQHISSDVLVNLIKRIKSTDVYYDIFQKVLELIYFDKAHPENHCLLIPNIRNNLW